MSDSYINLSNSKNAIVIASDHKGYTLKTEIITHLRNQYNIIDLGTKNLEKVDYPDYAKCVCESIIDDIAKYGILICDTGIGMSISSNRYSGIRAALCFNIFMAQRAKQHNNANILILGASLLENIQEYFLIIDTFLKTDFEGGRHISRLAKID